MTKRSRAGWKGSKLTKAEESRSDRGQNMSTRPDRNKKRRGQKREREGQPVLFGAELEGKSHQGILVNNNSK